MTETLDIPWRDVPPLLTGEVTEGEERAKAEAFKRIKDIQELSKEQMKPAFDLKDEADQAAHFQKVNEVVLSNYVQLLEDLLAGYVKSYRQANITNECLVRDNQELRKALRLAGIKSVRERTLTRDAKGEVTGLIDLEPV